MNEVRVAILRLVEAVQTHDFGFNDSGGQGRTLLSVGNRGKRIDFGYGYFQGSGVLFWNGTDNPSTATFKQMDNADGVTALLEGET